MRIKSHQTRALVSWLFIPLLIAGLTLTTLPVSAQEVSNRGKEFIITFLPNNGPTVVELHITGANTEVTIEYPMGNPIFSQTVSANEGDITIVTLPESSSLGWVPNSVNLNAVHAYSDEEFVIYMNNLRPFTTDSSVALPVAAMNTEYFALGYRPAQSNGSHFAVVAAFDDTTVFITPSNPMGSVAAGDTLEIQLDRGQAFFGRGNGSGINHDLTGTLITATRPVGMTSGNRCTTVPSGTGFCDTIFQVGHPTQTWGKQIPVANLPLRDGGVIYRILAAEDGTVVNRNGVPIATLDRGEFHETGFLTGNHLFSADEAISLLNS